MVAAASDANVATKSILMLIGLQDMNSSRTPTASDKKSF
jgi:hypothetical protein